MAAELTPEDVVDVERRGVEHQRVREDFDPADHLRPFRLAPACQPRFQFLRAAQTVRQPLGAFGLGVEHGFEPGQRFGKRREPFLEIFPLCGLPHREPRRFGIEDQPQVFHRFFQRARLVDQGNTIPRRRHSLGTGVACQIKHLRT